MSSSPGPPVTRGRGLALSHAETSPRTLVGLHRVNAQLQQELDKIDRQAFTAVSNIANHQQAMKMSWRRLEAQRSSPKVGAKRSSSTDSQNPAPSRSLMLTSNKTKLYVSATPQIYSGGGQQLQEPRGEEEEAMGKGGNRAVEQARDDADVPRSGSSSRLSGHPRGLPPPISTSPYISSPHMYRRESNPLKAEAAVPRPSPLATSSPAVKLPPILTSSSSQPSLVATTNKDTLLKISHMMGLDSHSHGPKTFQGFYTDRALARHGAVPRASDHAPQGEGGEGREEGEEGGVEEEEGRELTLADQFEQIRHCRYIRHYRPDGTAIDDPYELYQ